MLKKIMFLFILTKYSVQTFPVKWSTSYNYYNLYIRWSCICEVIDE